MTMKVTKTYCDCCEPPKELKKSYVIDIELKINDITTMNPPKFGKITLDGMWEIEVCEDCLDKAISNMGGMKI